MPDTKHDPDLRDRLLVHLSPLLDALELVVIYGSRSVNSAVEPRDDSDLDLFVVIGNDHAPERILEELRTVTAEVADAHLHLAWYSVQQLAHHVEQAYDVPYLWDVLATGTVVHSRNRFLDRLRQSLPPLENPGAFVAALRYRLAKVRHYRRKSLESLRLLFLYHWWSRATANGVQVDTLHQAEAYAKVQGDERDRAILRALRRLGKERSDEQMPPLEVLSGLEEELLERMATDDV